MTKEQHWGLRITDRLLHTSHVIDYGPNQADAVNDTHIPRRDFMSVELMARTATYTEWETAPSQERPPLNG